MKCTYLKTWMVAAPALLLAAGAANANSASYAVSFGFPSEVVATNANYPNASVFTGFTGGLANVTPEYASNGGTQGANFSTTGTVYSLGSYSLQATSAVGNYDVAAATSPTDPNGLTGNFLFSNTGNTSVGQPVTYSLTGLTSADSLAVYFINSNQNFGGEVAVYGGSVSQATLQGTSVPTALATVNVPDHSQWYGATGLTGYSSYTFAFQKPAGSTGEFDVGGMEIGVNSSAVPDSATLALLAVGGAGLLLVRRRRA